MAVRLGPDGLSPEDVIAVARDRAAVELTPAAVEAMARSRALVERLAEQDEPVYGISTGFGALASEKIKPAMRERLQNSLVRSHAAGVGPPIEPEVVRAMMLLRARSLAMGFSGVRPVLVERMVALLNAGWTPVVPEHGSLGASGDLAPLAHAALALLGEGSVTAADGATVPATTALAALGVGPLSLKPKEGLALINGTDGMLGMLVMACADLRQLAKAADVTAALSIEALLGTDRPFQPELHELRPHPGQAASAANLATLLAGSPIVASHRVGHDRVVQDAYSMRCAPQVAGAARDTLGFAERVVAIELRSAVDNPVVLRDGRVESNGNFHGAPLGFAADFLTIATAELGAIAERRVDRLLDATRSQGLPPFLAPEAGVDSGLMIAQYTAAALAAENRRLSTPASVDSVPTSGMQEDHVSMGWGAARKLRRAIVNLGRILGIELLAATHALDLRHPLDPAQASMAALALVREHIDGPGPDRFLAPDLDTAERLVRSGALLGVVEAATGPLN
jgi:histidine ammonia-lyase